MVCSLTGCACSGGSSAPQRGLGGEQDGVQLPGYALHTQSCSGTVQTQSGITIPVCVDILSPFTSKLVYNSNTFKNLCLSICGLGKCVSCLSEMYIGNFL